MACWTDWRRGHLIADFTAAIPVEIIGNLLGVRVAEREPFRDWSLAILGALGLVVMADAAARGKFLPIQTASTSPARRTAIWPLPPASINAPA